MRSKLFHSEEGGGSGKALVELNTAKAILLHVLVTLMVTKMANDLSHVEEGLQAFVGLSWATSRTTHRHEWLMVESTQERRP